MTSWSAGILYLTLHSLLGGPALGNISSAFSYWQGLLALPGVLTVVAHVVTTLLHTITKACSLSERTGLLTGTSIPIAPGGSGH